MFYILQPGQTVDCFSILTISRVGVVIVSVEHGSVILALRVTARSCVLLVLQRARQRYAEPHRPRTATTITQSDQLCFRITNWW